MKPSYRGAMTCSTGNPVLQDLRLVTAVQLDDQRPLNTTGISKGRTNTILLAKFEARDALCSEIFPELSPRIGRPGGQPPPSVQPSFIVGIHSRRRRRHWKH
jgi:hypothetical protein